MKEINKFFYSIFFLLILTFPASAENKILAIGNSDANIIIKVFSSLTCPHCANFHTNVFARLDWENKSFRRQYFPEDEPPPPSLKTFEMYLLTHHFFLLL